MAIFTPTTIVQQLVVSGTDTVAVAGTSRVYVQDYGAGTTMSSGVGYVYPSGTTVIGYPRVPTNPFVPNGFTAYCLGQFAVSGANTLTIQGTGQLILSDDFKTRSRIVLVGAQGF